MSITFNACVHACMCVFLSVFTSVIAYVFIHECASLCEGERKRENEIGSDAGVKLLLIGEPFGTHGSLESGGS